MTPLCSSRSRTELDPRRLWRCLSAGALLVALAAGCGGQSLSTDTGNPPVVGQLHLSATAGGVVVSGDPGAVPAGARVDVVNTATAEVASTTAAPDGSFEVELAGTPQDEYRVYVGSGQQSWRTRLTSSGSSAAETGIAGRTFLLDTAEGYPLTMPSSLQVSFRDDEMSFRASCNSFGGSYSLCDGRLCISQLANTDIGCDPERHAQDEWFASFFSSSPELTLAGARLELQGASARLTLLDREVANPDRPLTERTWNVDTLIQGGAASSVPGSSVPTLEFGSDGRLNVFDTCNGLGASYTRSGQTLTLSELDSDQKLCPGTLQLQQHIQAVIAEGQLSFEIEANRLTLTRGSVGLSATTD